jgi:hypothetical protein
MRTRYSGRQPHGGWVEIKLTETPSLIRARKRPSIGGTATTRQHGFNSGWATTLPMRLFPTRVSHRQPCARSTPTESPRRIRPRARRNTHANVDAMRCAPCAGSRILRRFALGRVPPSAERNCCPARPSSCAPYGSPECSFRASTRIGRSGSAFFHNARKSSYAFFALAVSPARVAARANPTYAKA